MAGQVTNTAAKSALPRTPDGHPDLQGTYDLATMTPLERLPGDPPFLTKEQAEALQKAEVARRAKDNEPSGPNRPAPPVGGDTSAPKSFFEVLEKAGGGAVGGYNRFWLQPGRGIHRGRWTNSNIHRRRPAGRPCASLQCGRAQAARGGPGDADVGPLRSARIAQPSRPVPTITRSSGRSASAACSDSVPLPVRRRCRTISTTICIRLCKLQTRS